MTARQPSKAEVHWVRSKFQLIVFLAMTVALAALGAGLLVGCGSDTNAEDTQGVASAETNTVLQKWLPANNQGDKEALVALYAENAILDDLTYIPPGRTEGSQEIADFIAGYANGGQGLGFEFRGQPIELGDYVIQAVAVTDGGTQIGEGVHVFQISGDGQITHHWAVMGSGEE